MVRELCQDLWPMGVIILGVLILAESALWLGRLEMTPWKALASFGKNQWFLAFLHGGVILASLIGVAVSDSATFVDWLNFVVIYGPIAGGSATVPSMMVKRAAYANGHGKKTDLPV